LEKLVLVGAGGHFKVVFDIVKSQYDIFGVTDADESKEGSVFYNCRVIGNDEKLRYIYQQGVPNALITVGSITDSNLRQSLYKMCKDIGFHLPNVISPKAIISDSVQLGEGNVIMDMAVLHGDTRIGSNSIINTGAIIEHDCVIEDHVHVAPGAKLAGAVTVGGGSHIGIGAVVIQGICIGKNSIVGAGAVVIKDVPDGETVIGVPAKPIKR
jgi:sugar O-acyltransferase, sialic acid O-acetyltransferase NeuD family